MIGPESVGDLCIATLLYLFIYLFIFKDFIYLFIRYTERDRGTDTGRGRSRLHPGKPDVGLDPRSPGSHPGLKAALNC